MCVAFVRTHVRSLRRRADARQIGRRKVATNSPEGRGVPPALLLKAHISVYLDYQPRLSRCVLDGFSAQLAEAA
jgi:hypothetical protein